MALGFLYGSGGGGGQPEPAIKRLVDGPDINNLYNVTVLSLTTLSNGIRLTRSSAYGEFTLVGVDLTNYKNLTISSTTNSSNGITLLSIGTTSYTQQVGGKNGTTGESVINVSAFTGANDITFALSFTGTADIYSITLEPYPEAVFPVIYNHGSWGVGCESKGDYTYTESGWSAADMIINPDNIAVNTSAGSSKDCIMGTTNKVDLTNYTMMKCICKGMNSMGAGRMRICSGKNAYTQSLGNYYMSAGTSPTEFAWDISTYTGEYYLVIESESVRNAYYYKWWLE